MLKQRLYVTIFKILKIGIHFCLFFLPVCQLSVSWFLAPDNRRWKQAPENGQCVISFKAGGRSVLSLGPNTFLISYASLLFLLGGQDYCTAVH